MAIWNFNKSICILCDWGVRFDVIYPNEEFLLSKIIQKKNVIDGEDFLTINCKKLIEFHYIFLWTILFLVAFFEGNDCK